MSSARVIPGRTIRVTASTIAMIAAAPNVVCRSPMLSAIFP